MKRIKWSVLPAALMVVALFVASAAAGNIFEEELEKEALAVKLVEEVRRGDYDVVSTETLKAWIDSGKEMVIVDAMPYDHFKKKHIPGARQFLFPIPEMDGWDTGETGGKTQADYEALLGPDRDKPVVVYCGFVKCTRSHNGAMWARRLGFTNVYRHPGGIYAWQSADYPMESVD